MGRRANFVQGLVAECDADLRPIPVIGDDIEVIHPQDFAINLQLEPMVRREKDIVALFRSRQTDRAPRRVNEDVVVKLAIMEQCPARAVDGVFPFWVFEKEFDDFQI